MSFTYDTTTDIGKVRLELDDTTVNAGVRPSGANLTDEEIQVWLTREGSVGAACAAACGMLARAWARMASTSIGPMNHQFGTISEGWAKRAAELRQQYGGGSSGAFSVTGQRDDAYHVYNEFDDDPDGDYNNRTLYIKV